MKKNILTFLSVAFFITNHAFAATTAILGDDAKKLFEANKGKAQTLVQKDKLFSLRAPDGTMTTSPASITVAVGEPIFITNEEEKYVHNVYDATDSSWVIQKQNPGDLDAITFDTAGTHKFICAIHPKMSIEVIVK